MNPLVSLITLNWNRKDDLSRTVASLKQQTYPSKEIIVVDNGSTDGSVAEMKKNHPDVRLLELPQNAGVQGYNRGIESSNGEFVLLVDNDMDLMQTNTIEQFLEYFSANPKLGAVALQVREGNRIQLSTNNPKFSAEDGNETKGYPCSAFDGGGVALRKDVLQKTGPYLPQFFIYHSEVDLSTRIWDAGWEIRYFPSIAVSHRESPVSRDSALQTFYSTRNYLWYVWIYYPAGMAVSESFHFLQMSCIQNLRGGKSMWAWLKGVCTAIFQWNQVSSLRRPAKRETLEWMQQLREKDRKRKLQGKVNV